MVVLLPSNGSLKGSHRSKRTNLRWNYQTDPATIEYCRVDFEQIRFLLGCVCWEDLRLGKHMSPDYFPTSHKTILFYSNTHCNTSNLPDICLLKFSEQKKDEHYYCTDFIEGRLCFSFIYPHAIKNLSAVIVDRLLQATDLKLDAELLSENRASGGITANSFF